MINPGWARYRARMIDVVAGLRVRAQVTPSILLKLISQNHNYFTHVRSHNFYN